MILRTWTSGFLRASLPFNPVNFPKFAAWGWCWSRQRRMNDWWMASFSGRKGWWEAAFKIIFYIQLWVSAGSQYTVPDLSMGERSIVLKQRAIQMIYLCSSAAFRFFGSRRHRTVLRMRLHVCACARTRVCVCVCVCARACVNARACVSCDPPVSTEPIISSSETR